MPANLFLAHQALDMAVDAAYGYKSSNINAASVAVLFERYQEITSMLPSAANVKKARKSMLERPMIASFLCRLIRCIAVADCSYKIIDIKKAVFHVKHCFNFLY